MFDLGGVLIEISVFDKLNELLSQPQDKQSLKERWLFSPAVRGFESGQITADAFAEKFIAEWQIQLSPQTFLEEFSSWAKGFYPDARETIGHLRLTHRVACFSNSNPLHWRKFGGYENDFDIALSSHLLGVTKPDHEAFVRAIGECGVEPADIYFFDDSAPNVNAAQSLGMRAFWVEDFESLQQVLRSEELLS